ncbi:MAG: hypothetical protein IPH35_18850 [Rhodoferax sp.]|nr:hypothetical protein [Rhodoferax sp.]
MAHELKTVAGKKRYALRKQTVEPVFGIIKSIMGFASFQCAVLPLQRMNGTWCACPGI